MMVLGETTPVARIQHQCQLCLRTIEPGERYHRQRSLGHDGPYVFKCCWHCHAFVSAIDLYYDDGYTLEDIAEHEPASVQEARWLVQWRRHWRRRDGALYPVPGGAS